MSRARARSPSGRSRRDGGIAWAWIPRWRRGGSLAAILACRRYSRRMAQDISPFLARRRRIAAALHEAGGGVAIVPTAPERQRNSDNDHPYRHGSDFHYLTGFAEPGAWLAGGSGR